MTSRIIQSDTDRAAYYTLLEGRKYPYTVTVKSGKDRSQDQNRLMWKWMAEAEDQLQEYTASEYQAWCKLHIGVPILRRDDDFRAAYDEVIKPLPYEMKLKAMSPPLDFPVSRLMTTKQFTRFLDTIYAHFKSLGVQLTEPDDGGN